MTEFLQIRKLGMRKQKKNVVNKNEKIIGAKGILCNRVRSAKGLLDTHWESKGIIARDSLSFNRSALF